MTWATTERVAGFLREHHYLGPIRRGVAWQDDYGVIVVTSPTSRRLPTSWLELARWCITSKEKNAGSRQWAAFSRALRELRTDATTIVSYSDPSVGHTGALYRACNWLWAPTWHRLRPPPTGNGRWKEGGTQSVKDRWVFCLRQDEGRSAILRIADDAVLKRFPWSAYQEPGGVPYKLFLEVQQGVAP